MITRHALSLAALMLSAGAACAQNCIWNPITPAGVSPPARYSAAMTYDSARGRVVLFGGRIAYYGPFLNDTWEWDGTSWTLKATTGPSPRHSVAMAYHAGLGKTILFGGMMANPVDALTWQWDGAQWTSMPLSNGSYVPFGAGMVYDAQHDRMVIYGGSIVATQNTYPTRYLEAGGNWAPFSIASPPERWAFSLAYDPDRARIVLYGGAPYYSTDEVWEFDGALQGAWTLVGHGPPARTNASMAYDSARHRMVLVGGNNNDYLGDAWEYDGVMWTRRADDGPVPRDQACLAFDAARSTMLYFGGYAPQPRNDMWRFDGGNTQSTLLLSITQQPPLVMSGAPASLTVTAVNATGYQWSRNGVPLTNGGIYSGVTTPTLTLSSVTRPDIGPFTVTIYGPCYDLPKTCVFNFTDPLSCYCNCDQSTVVPYLTANDFQCFLNKYAAGDSYANCDHSTTPPAINANDFQCFLNTFAAGCP